MLLSAESLSIRPAGGLPGGLRRLGVRLRLRVRRLSAVGANAVELRGLMGVLATFFSGIAWVLLLLRNVLARLWKRFYRFASGEVEALLNWLRARDTLRLEVYHLWHEAKARPRPRMAPMVFMACCVVMMFYACSSGLGFEVQLDGESLGYVQDRSQVEEVVERVEKRISIYQGALYNLETHFSYKLGFLDDDRLLDEEALEERLFASVPEEERQYLLTVDGQTIGSSTSRSALTLMLRQIMLRACDNATQVNTSFVNDVQVQTTTQGETLLTDISEMQETLSQNREETLIYTVKSGDTVSAIGKKYDLKIAEIEALNPGLDPAKIHVGQELVLSAAVPYLSIQQTVTEAYQEAIPFDTIVEYSDSMYTYQSKYKVEGVDGLADVVADVTYVNGIETQRVVTSYVVLQEPVTAIKVKGTKRSVTTGSFIKPCSLRFSSGYGNRKSLGDYHTGVDWAGKVGSKIWAADGGTVIWAGKKGNYGKYIIIDHGNGYQTYYCHCSELLVSKGDKVAQGQVIAKVGATGRVTGPHLHFEIRYKGKTKNPLNYVSK